MKKHQFPKITHSIHDERFRLIRRCRVSFIACVMLCFLGFIWTFSGGTAPVWSADALSIPSYGKGPKELIVFTDYFCPPCMTIESELEPAIQKLLAKGEVRVTFVDFPGHQPTALYAKYYLYATQAAPGYKNAMQARNVLFTLSKQNLAKTEADVEKAFQENGVAFKPFNPKPIYSEWNQVIKKHKITQTPTCILKYSETDVRRYEGTTEIRSGLLAELDAQGKKGKR